MVLVQQAEIGYEAYVELALADPDRQLELYRGRVREKPGTSMDHNRGQRRLDRQLQLQLDDRTYEVCSNSAHLRAPSGAVFIPDVVVVPTAWVDALAGRSDVLEIYDEQLPLVVEVWSPSTNSYDVNDKLTEYRRRGDLEIWRVHPYDRTVTIWRRQNDGSYAEEVVTGGIVGPAFLPDVAVDLDGLFARL